jgi:hypothetical protein
MKMKKKLQQRAGDKNEKGVVAFSSLMRLHQGRTG